MQAVRLLYYLVVITLLPAIAYPQLPNQRIIDSLTNLANKSPSDSDKVRLLSQLSKTYYPIDFKKGIDFGNQALHLAEKIGWKEGVLKANNALGANYWARYDFIRAQDYYGAALKIARELGDKKSIAINLHDIGVCYDITGNPEKAVEYYKRAIKAASESGFKDMEMGSYSNIADLYATKQKYNEALDYYSHSLKLSGEINKPINRAYYFQKIGTIYSALGNHKKALEYGRISIDSFAKLKNDEGLAYCLNGQGKLYIDAGNYEEAIKQCSQALKVLARLKGTPTKKLEADFYLTLGGAYFQFAKHSYGKIAANYLHLAASGFEKAVAIDKAIDFRESADFALKNLSEVYEALGEHAKALQVYKEYVVNKDSITNSEKLKEYTRHELAFEYSRQRDSLNYTGKLQKQEMAEIKALAESKLKQRSLYAVVAIVILLLIASYFFFRSRVQQLRFRSELAQEKAQQQIKEMGFESKLNDLTLASLKSQMNPHFIFNCLNSIKFYVEKNETDAASLYITKFSKLIRNILDSARSEKISLTTEIELIGLYLEMEAMRLKDKLNYKIEIAANIDGDFIEIPPLLIQPYVENAIWHGLMPKADGGNITIGISIENDSLLINIEDDGIGRENAEALKRKNKFNHTSHGSALNNERIAMFNARYKTNTRVVITDLTDGAGQACGTRITIKMLL